MESVDLALIILCVFMIGICYGDGKNESIIVTAVMRRVDSDIYYCYNFSNHFRCEEQLPTFMVEEKKCRKNEDFFNGRHMHAHNIIITQMSLYAI